MSSPEKLKRRLEQLYEITKLFVSFESVQLSFDPALAIVTKTLPLRSAVLIEADGEGTRMTVWPSEGQFSEEMRAVKEHVTAAYAYLVGAASPQALGFTEQAGATRLPRPAGSEPASGKRFIVIPLVLASRAPFGALQLETAQPPNEADLMFVNAIANQLAVALDGDRAARVQIARRLEAEALAAENKRLYEQARQAVQGREQVLAVVSHDLRTPLSTIILASEALLGKWAGQEAFAAGSLAVARIHRSGERMLRLIEDLLDFASIEAGKLAIKRGPHDAASMIQEVIGHFEESAREHRLQFSAEIGARLPKADCDRDRILQVFANLVGNATKVTAAGGQITLRVEARGDELQFAVSDTGPGIGGEDLEHLFERYWRSGDAEYKGTGLGLAIARGIVNAHGGHIWAVSELGHGATFFFTIPAAGIEPRRAGP